MSESTRLVTAEELEKLPEDDCRYELVEGRLIRMSPVGYLQARSFWSSPLSSFDTSRDEILARR